MEENRKLRIRLTNDNNNVEDKYKLERVKTFTTPTLNAVINAINTSNKKIIEMETLGRGIKGIFDKEITFTINNASEFSKYISNEYAKDTINSVIRGVRAGCCR